MSRMPVRSAHAVGPRAAGEPLQEPDAVVDARDRLVHVRRTPPAPLHRPSSSRSTRRVAAPLSGAVDTPPMSRYCSPVSAAMTAAAVARALAGRKAPWRMPSASSSLSSSNIARRERTSRRRVRAAARPRPRAGAEGRSGCGSSSVPGRSGASRGGSASLSSAARDPLDDVVADHDRALDDRDQDLLPCWRSSGRATGARCRPHRRRLAGRSPRSPASRTGRRPSRRCRRRRAAAREVDAPFGPGASAMWPRPYRSGLRDADQPPGYRDLDGARLPFGGLRWLIDRRAPTADPSRAAAAPPAR